MKLTTAQRRLLQDMADAEGRKDFEDAEVVCEGITCWIGHRQTSRRTVNALLMMVLLSEETEGKGVYRYTLNGSGRAVLQDESVLDRLQTALHSGACVDQEGHPV